MTLDEAALDPDPIRQLRVWLEEAWAARIPNAEAGALATATADGRPSVRFVLLRGFDDGGVVFYTNRESRKGEELAANPRAALALYWQPFGRQARAEGLVEELTRAEVESYFRSRPRGSQLGAWASPQSSVIATRAVVLERVDEVAVQYPEEVPPPPFWGGYRIVPDEVELWLHQDSRLHERLRYRLDGGRWRVDRLAP